MENDISTFDALHVYLNQTIKLRAKGRDNSQRCWANNAGSCHVRVGSAVQTDATTPDNVGTCSASWEGYTHKTLETMCNTRVCPQQCWKSCANKSNIIFICRDEIYPLQIIRLELELKS